ncbi:hypothetical protein [Paraburkholderia sp. SIMBA_030]|uniref:hypothetical protein n=1 Tax=Paraburkholderia sp. SIMBA_030 TaxID=3085773 RepID=UPI00397C68B5
MSMTFSPDQRAHPADDGFLFLGREARLVQLIAHSSRIPVPAGGERWGGLDASNVVFSNASLSATGRGAIVAVGRSVPDAVAALVGAPSQRSCHANTNLRSNSIPEKQDRPEIERFVHLCVHLSRVLATGCQKNQHEINHLQTDLGMLA